MRKQLYGLARKAGRVCARKDFFRFLALSVVSALCGAMCGYLLGYLVMQQRAEAIADLFDQRILSVVDASEHEVYGVFNTLQGSPYAACSDEDLAWMRMQVYRADYLNEVARMRGQQMLCSTSLGRVAAGGIQLAPRFSYANQYRLYWNPEPYQRANLTILGVQKGNWMVILRPVVQTFFGTAPFHFSISAMDANGQVQMPSLGNAADAPTWIIQENRRMRWKDQLYATHCDEQARFCVTASIPVAVAIGFGRFGITATAVFGGLLGACSPWLLTLLGPRRQAMERQLRAAIRRKELFMVYMPIVDLSSRSILGAEALVRWNDEEGHAVSPEVFVRLAEERGFIGEITEQVVGRVLREFGGYLRSHPDFRISVNATATDFADPKFMPMLHRSLRRASVRPQSLIIEITESSTARQEVVRETIRQLRQDGFHVHIDDFGTGYSSLAYLHELRVDAIKIDRSFTQAIGTKAVTVTVLPQIMAMADALRLDVVVEGIETEEQAAYFTDLAKPHRAQGWLFGAPVAASVFARRYAGSDGYGAMQIVQMQN